MIYNIEPSYSEAEQYVRDFCAAYPMLVRTYGRVAVLYHTFFVLGNGCEWLKGKLRYSPMDINSLPVTATSHDPFFQKSYKKHHVELLKIYKKVRDNIDTYSQMVNVSDYPSALSPSHHTLIYNIPFDVKPDWFELAKEAYYMFYHYNLYSVEHEMYFAYILDRFISIENYQLKTGMNNLNS